MTRVEELESILGRVLGLFEELPNGKYLISAEVDGPDGTYDDEVVLSFSDSELLREAEEVLNEGEAEVEEF